MKDVEIVDSLPDLQVASFRSCLASILELALDALPNPDACGDPATDPTVSRWLGGLRLGLVPIAEPRSFAWAGPWLARVRPPDAPPRFVVMYGHPSGVVWDPAQAGPIEHDWIDDGFLVAAADIALARPQAPADPVGFANSSGSSPTRPR